MKLVWIKRGIAGSGECGEESKELNNKEGEGEVEWAWRPALGTSKRKFFL